MVPNKEKEVCEAKSEVWWNYLAVKSYAHY